MNFNIRLDKLVYTLVISLLLSSCSNRQMYNALQKNRQSECQKLPPAQSEECMKELDETYESYKQKLKEFREANNEGS